MYFFIPRLATLARQAFGLPCSLCGSNEIDENGHFLSEMVSLCIWVYSVNFFERHVSLFLRSSKSDKNGHLLSEMVSNFSEHHVFEELF